MKSPPTWFIGAGVLMMIIAILLIVFWGDITGKDKTSVTTDENKGPSMIDPASIKISAGKSS